tara:strand:+ start:187 stop:360 length:174 start_codon:yes stop_codon:yes gene_type:complete
MFTDKFLNSLVNFLFIILSKKKFTKAKIKKAIVLFTEIWRDKIKKPKKGRKNAKRKS